MSRRRLFRGCLLLSLLVLLLILLTVGAAPAASDPPQAPASPAAMAAPAGEEAFVAEAAPIDEAATVYIDVPLGAPYAAAIYALATAQIITGFPDRTFRPDAPIKRMQFAKMICLGMVLTPSLFDPCPFTDVPSGLDPLDPFYPDHYVTAAYKAGVTQGKSATKYAPYDAITRYQLISMMVRAAQQQMPGRIVMPPSWYQSTWDPASSKDHGQNARIAEYNGMLDYLPLAQLDPWGAMPRGEVAQVVYNTIF